MLSMKGVFLLILLAVICPHPAIGKNPICSRANMEEILNKCYIFIKRPHFPLYVVSQNSPCCEAVRKVLGRDMRLILILLKRESEDRQNGYSEVKILRLRDLCVPPPPSRRRHAPPPHRQVMV
uniref:Bifunctional inhibitor/plant lipid transfer protein/seed storage helical domain-containing protein n=1 Tax=Oryza punctata TaxID=4537 RepID=A0A0E0MED2_ORYPU